MPGARRPYRSTAYVALLDFEKRSVTVRIEEEATEGDSEAPKPDTAPDMDQRPAKEFQLPDGVRFDRAVSGEEEWDSGVFKLTFYPDGGSSGGAVILADEKDHRYRVVVDFITGTVYLGSDES